MSCPWEDETFRRIARGPTPEEKQEGIDNEIRRAAIVGAEVWTVTVVDEGRTDFIVFSSELKASDWAKACPMPCVISTRIVDVPEHYFGEAQ